MSNDPSRAELGRRALALVRAASLAGRSVRLDGDTHLLKTGVLDSLAIVELAAVIAREFAVTLPPAKVTPKNFQSVATITELIASLKEVSP